MKKLVASLVLLLCSVNAQAILLTDLINGGSITAGDKLFDDWQIMFTDSSDFRQFDFDNIDVTALNDGGLDPGPGLHFDILNDEFKVDGDGFYAYLDFMFGFRVSVLDPDLLIKDNSLRLTGATLGNPSSLTSVFIEEMIYADDTQADLLGIKDVEFSQLFDLDQNMTEVVKLFDSAQFAPTSSIFVTKNILVEAEAVGEFAMLESFEQRFSQTRVDVTEPHTFMLWGAGLVLWIARRRQRN